MKNLNTALICASTVLFANSASAGWSVGGFVGQSSINGCRPINIPTTISGPVSTLTTTSFDTVGFNEALSEISSSGQDDFSDLVFNSNVIPSFVSFDTNTLTELFNRTEGFTTITQTSINGVFPSLEAAINTANEPVITSFTNIDIINPSSIENFDPSSLSEFIVNTGVSDFGSFDRATQGSIIPTTETTSPLVSFIANNNNNVTQSLDVTNQLFECDTGDDEDFGFGLNIAYNFTKNWGIEAGYVDLGEFSATLSPQNVDVINPTNIDVDASAFYLAGTASYYYSKKWSVTGRLGAYQIDIDRRLSSDPFSLVVETGSGSIVSNFGATSSTTSFKDEDVYYGASLNYDFNEKFQVQLRYDNFDIDLISLGLRYSL